MSEPGHPRWSIHELRSHQDDYLPALHLALTGQPQRPPYVAQEVQDLQTEAAAGNVQIRPVIGAYESSRLRLAVVGVESLGSSNLLLLPFDMVGTFDFPVAALSLQQALLVSLKNGVALAQVIGPEGPSKWDALLREAGMAHLTDLLYLNRSVPSENHAPAARAEVDQEWVTYSPETESLFCESLQDSYVQSLDCPELTELRSPRDMLMGHRSAGPFDPSLWFVLPGGHRPRGILLLSRARHEPAMEIVYMGVAQVFRGRGVADALMRKAVSAAGQRLAETLILAVDSRNEPARRFYQRWKFQEVARRGAWIAKLCRDGS